MIHPVRAWNRFFFQPTSARPLGALRIAFGLVALFNLAITAVDLDLWYSGAGLLQGNESRLIGGDWQYSPLQVYQDPATVRAVFLATAVAAGFLTIGLWTRLASLLFYLGMLTIHHRNLISSSGADVLVMTFAFNLLLCPCGAAYSVDSWWKARRRGTLAEPLIIPWGQRLIQIQISLVYTFAVLLKFGGPLWLNGTALHFVFNNTEVDRVNVSFLTHYPILINLMTYSALAMELSLAFFLWFRHLRPVVLMIGFMLHAGIMVTINIPVFGELMWVGYLAFLTPPEFDAILRALDVRRWFGRKQEVRAATSSSPASITVRIDPPAAGVVPRPHLAPLPLEVEPPSVRRYEDSAREFEAGAAEDDHDERAIFGTHQIYS